MARHVSRQSVAGALAALAAVILAPAVAAAATASELVRYGFDDDVATGPDTLQVFQNARGSVRISSEFSLGGYRSVEIRDVAKDGAFPELLGRFPLRSEGRLYAHFGFLVTDTEQSWNVALAGPEWFALKKDGIGFWLEGRGGSLYHVSDSTPKRLFPLRSFVWYVVDVTYDVGAGTYDLSVREESSKEPLVSLASQPNATAHPGSGVQVFSFIGDTGSDTSEVVYYVDDIVLAADRPVDLALFVAPGRRKLFVDAWNDHKRRLASEPGCFPVSDVALDLGLDPSLLQGSTANAAQRVLEGALDPRGPRPPVKTLGKLEAPLAAVVAWAHGCEELRAQRVDDARAAFERAESLWPRGRIYPLSRALALARAKRTDEADRLLASIAGLYRDDLRPEIATALVGIARDDLDAALLILAPPAEGLPTELRGDVLRLAEQYFFVLLWKGSFADALRYASAVTARAREAALPTTEWSEHVGDAAFLLGDATAALGAYREALMSRDGKDARLYEKLADAYFRLGDLEQERVWREQVYGSLR